MDIYDSYHPSDERLYRARREAESRGDFTTGQDGAKNGSAGQRYTEGRNSTVEEERARATAKAKMKPAPISSRLGREEMQEIYREIKPVIAKMRDDKVKARVYGGDSPAKRGHRRSSSQHHAQYRAQYRIVELLNNLQRSGHALLPKLLRGIFFLPEAKGDMGENWRLEGDGEGGVVTDSAIAGRSYGQQGRVGGMVLMSGVIVFSGLKLATDPQMLDVHRAIGNRGPAPAVAMQGNMDSGQSGINMPKSEPLPEELFSPDRVGREIVARKKELERKGASLKEREAELSLQEQEIAAKIGELRGLIDELQKQRKTKDKEQSQRFEQLASVYGSMQPNEAASLLEKMDNNISLRLMELLPEKKVAMILSQMNQAKALELTKLLSDERQGGKM